MSFGYFLIELTYIKCWECLHFYNDDKNGRVNKMWLHDCPCLGGLGRVYTIYWLGIGYTYVFIYLCFTTCTPISIDLEHTKVVIYVTYKSSKIKA